jgi:hypothetical protein
MKSGTTTELWPGGSSISSFQVGHGQFFGWLFLMGPRVPTDKVEAAEDAATNHEDHG